MMSLTVNGASRRIHAGATLGHLLETLGVTPRKIAIERNGEIVPATTYDETTLQPNDHIEIIQFVGGG